MKPLAVICLIWGLASLGLYGAGRVLPGEVFRVFDYVSIGVCLYSASIIMQIYLTRIEPRFSIRHALRTVWLLTVVVIFITAYSLAAAGVRSNLLTGSLTLTLILFACILGAWLASHLKRPAEIVAVGVTAGLADLFSVFKGPTKVLSESIADYYEGGMQGLPPLVDFVLVKIPMPGQKAFMPVFGITDWIIIAFFSAAAFKFNMRDNIFGKPMEGTIPVLAFFPVTCTGLAVAIFFAREARIFLPALPFAVIVYLIFMLVKYPEMRRFTKAELVPMIGVSALLICLMILM